MRYCAFCVFLWLTSIGKHFGSFSFKRYERVANYRNCCCLGRPVKLVLTSMKRNAAILGPTPPFLRWAIALPCPLRDVETKGSLPDATFRQLRTLRALSVGQAEGRVQEGFCLHPDAIDGDSSLGFPVDEVYQAYGGIDLVASACRDCPANVSLDGKATPGLAGCFGWLAFDAEDTDGSRDFVRLMRCESEGSSRSDLVTEFQRATTAISFGLSRKFRPTNPSWYGVWSHGRFEGKELELLSRICAKVQCNDTAWLRLVAAIRHCIDQALTLVTDLMPRGISDGIHWTLKPACRICSFCRAATSQACPCCGGTDKPSHSRRMNVLGMRPYLNLEQVVGEAGLRLLKDRTGSRKNE